MAPTAGSVRSTSARPTTDVLVALLTRALRRRLRGRRIVSLKRRLSPYRSSFNLENLDVQIDDGTSLSLVFKDLSLGAMLEDARRARPEFLYQPQREIQTYRRILARRGMGTATCYGSVVDEPHGRYWLFLERVPGLELRHVGEFATWQRAAQWLADLHTRVARATRSLHRASELQLVRYDADYYRVWMQRARAFTKPSIVAGPARARKGIEWLARRYDPVVERLLALPVTLIHGDFFASNVRVQKTNDEPRVCPVDWEMTAIGPGLMDLATLCAGWNEPERSALVLTYRDALRGRHARPASPEQFFVDLDCCRLFLAVKMLGWSDDWSAPRHHAHNWLGEAVRAATRLEAKR